MNNKIIIPLLLIILVVGGFVVAKKYNSTEKDSQSMQMPPVDDKEQAPEESGVLDLTNQTEVSIDIQNFAYSKPNIKIKKGTKVTWTNQDTVKHNAMKEHEDSGKPHSAPTKEEVKPTLFSGPLLAKGESYSFTFNDAGPNPYHCAPHPWMKGLITVSE